MGHLMSPGPFRPAAHRQWAPLVPLTYMVLRRLPSLGCACQRASGLRDVAALTVAASLSNPQPCSRVPTYDEH